MLTLTFNQSHASITSFPTATLSDFTLITGTNGAGKTHLLQAIYQGFVKTDVAPEQSPQNPSQIRLFDWSTMVPQDTGAFSSENLRTERQNIFNQYNSLRQNTQWLEPARNIIRSHCLGSEYLGDPAKALSLSKEELQALLSPEGAANLTSQLTAAMATVEQNILSNFDLNTRAQLRAVSAHTKRPLFSLRQQDILSPAIPTWGQSDLFQQSFARLFVAYRDLKLANSLAEFTAHKGEAVDFLSDEDFTKEHGTAPWDFVNTSLENARLDFEINSPSRFDYAHFQPVLRKKSTGVEIPFASLSSGEKVLMSFAFCVYYSNDRRQISNQPKVLLLDEIDAPLHPSMSRSVIDTISTTLVQNFGIKVVATTHSPSTVAIAPEDSLFTMKAGVPGLTKSSKAAALNILTVGVPTLSISFDGRRQVFVESPIDAKLYELCFRLLKPTLSSERSLEFVATGTRVKGSGDINTGCDVVRRLVSELAAAGNTSVYGLLDWDGVNASNHRIGVLAEGRMNGLENVLLDPLLIGMTICRSFPDEKQTVGVPAQCSYREVCGFSKEGFQGIATAVADTIFGGKALQTRERSYIGGLAISTDVRCCTTDDHEYEDLVLEAYPFLRAISKNQSGNLIEYIISNVLADSPALMPEEVKLVIANLLEREAHEQARLATG